MRILITGGAGFIGSHLCEALLDAGASVRALVYYNAYGGPDMFYQDPGRRGGACANPGYGLNKTTVVWQAGPLAINPNPIRILPLEGVRNAVGRFGALGGCQGCR